MKNGGLSFLCYIFQFYVCPNLLYLLSGFSYLINLLIYSFADYNLITSTTWKAWQKDDNEGDYLFCFLYNIHTNYFIYKHTNLLPFSAPRYPF